MLSLPPDAPSDEIKKAFRREIARYHPDKVQHLGPEFQEMASGIAADLTEAYRILMDPAMRAKYNDDLLGGATERPATYIPRPPDSEDPPPAASSSSSASASSFSSAYPSSSSSWSTPPPSRPSSPLAGVDFVKKASLSRMKAAIDQVMPNPEPGQVAGFDLAVTTKPKRGLFKKADEKVRLLVKFVALVDATAVADTWAGAMKARDPEATLCVLLVGPALAPSKELAGAISEQRRKSRTVGPVLVPVDVRDWEALFPPDTPAQVRTLIQALKDEKR